MLPGAGPLVLVAPHGGRRDYTRRPWGSMPLKVNDLHTAALTEELAGATGAPALINADLDRNDVDLNRLSAAHDRAPAFLERLLELVSAAVARHGRATVVTVHGWNVIQPAVDIGVGWASHDRAWDDRAAVSPQFARHALPALVGACTARQVTATVGSRYPARARENLVQLFTAHYRADARPLVRELAGLGSCVDAVQLELGVPLRCPGAWRRRLVDACLEALPALRGDAAVSGAGLGPGSRPACEPLRRTIEIAGDEASGLLAMDGAGARLLIFLPDGGLAMFTGERTGGEEPGRVGGLRIDEQEDGTVDVAFAGPMMRFPDTTPFLDLERGLGQARLIENARIGFVLRPEHDGCAGFGTVRGDVQLDGERLVLAGRAHGRIGAPAAVWPRVRLACALAPGEHLSLLMEWPGGPPMGFLCRGRTHHPVTAAAVRVGGGDPLDGLELEVEIARRHRLIVRPRVIHRLPVIRSGPPLVRLIYASCQVPDVEGVAGWCELGGI